MTKTITELRTDFERMAMSDKFDIERNVDGEYFKIYTRMLWYGYWECAKKHNIVTGVHADFESIKD